MKKRIVVALLWFYAAWVAWAMVAQLTGFSELAGPVLGAAAAAFFAGDPLHRIWTRAPERVEAPAPTTPIGGRQIA